jgi:seryl-tRNA synthetase
VFLVAPEDAERMLEHMKAVTEEFYQALKLPY